VGGSDQNESTGNFENESVGALGARARPADDLHRQRPIVRQPPGAAFAPM